MNIEEDHSGGRVRRNPFTHFKYESVVAMNSNFRLSSMLAMLDAEDVYLMNHALPRA
jgi:hypothetical protein